MGLRRISRGGDLEGLVMVSLNRDIGQRQVVVDVELVDGSQVGDSMIVVQMHIPPGININHVHAEPLVRARDLHLKRLSRGEGEEIERSLLLPPRPPDAAVPDDHLLAVFVEAGVEVEGQISLRSMSHGQIHRDLDGVGGYDDSSDGYDESIIDAVGKHLRVRNPQAALWSGCWTTGLW